MLLTRRRGFFLISVTCTRVICRQFPPHGGVSSDRKECTELGVQLLRDGGSAVDAAVGAVLCLGVLQPRRAGLGGSVALLPCLLSVDSYVRNLLIDTPRATTLPGKSWKVVEFSKTIFQAWKVMENSHCHGKSWKMMIMSWNFL